MVTLVKKMIRVVLSLTLIILFCPYTVIGDTHRAGGSFFETARPGSLTDPYMKAISSEFVGTWILEESMDGICDMSAKELEKLNTMHLLQNGTIVDKYNNGPIVKKYEVKSGKLVVTTYLKSDYNKGEAEINKKYYSIVNDNGIYKIASETGRIYVRISPDENAEIIK